MEYRKSADYFHRKTLFPPLFFPCPTVASIQRGLPGSEDVIQAPQLCLFPKIHDLTRRSRPLDRAWQNTFKVKKLWKRETTIHLPEVIRYDSTFDHGRSHEAFDAGAKLARMNTDGPDLTVVSYKLGAFEDDKSFFLTILKRKTVDADVNPHSRGFQWLLRLDQLDTFG